MRLKQLEIYEWFRKKARDLEFEGQRTTLWYQHSPHTSIVVLGINNARFTYDSDFSARNRRFLAAINRREISTVHTTS